MGKKILFISTMYPNPLRPGTLVCQFFTRDWKRMGYEVLVIHYRSMFPGIYTILAKLFPKLALKYVGNHVEMDRNMKIVEYVDSEGIPAYSIPIFKFLPHGKYSKRTIDKKVTELKEILNNRDFEPDAIIGHFYNPQLEIVSKLKSIYPAAKTCVSLHEYGEAVYKLLQGNAERVLAPIDFIGFRSVSIKNSFEHYFGYNHKSLLCWSGTPEAYLKTPSTIVRSFSDGPLHSFIYVGQTIKRKYPKQTIEGVHKAMGDQPFSLTYVGSHDLGYPETVDYINTYRLNDKVTFTGKIPREDIIKYYDKSECFILISKDEVFGLVYLEAMSRGCITIAARNEGMEGIIEHGVNGFLCEAGNPNELAEIIRHINSLSAEEKNKISEKGKATATELSDINVARSYIDTVLNS